MRLLITTLLLAILLFCKPAHGDEVVEIPLREIWAYGMPGTRDISELAKQESQLMGFRHMLEEPPPKDKPARTAFAVEGTGLEAFRNSDKVLADQQVAKQVFDSDSEISIVFFSFSSNWYIHLQSIEVKSDTITIHYNMVSRETHISTDHFALIPLGKLSSGEYQVDIIPSQINGVGEPVPFPLDMEVVNRIVSGSFSFIVKEGK